MATALGNLPTVQARADVAWPRMVDFAQWAAAAEPALGLDPGAFLAAYATNRDEAAAALLETSPVVAALLRLLARSGCRFTGTAQQLLSKLEIGLDPRGKEWPKNARTLAGKLNRFAPALRAAGITITHGRAGNDKTLCIRREPQVGDPAARPQSTQRTQKTGPVPKYPPKKPSAAGKKLADVLAEAGAGASHG